MKDGELFYPEDKEIIYEEIVNYLEVSDFSVNKFLRHAFSGSCYEEKDYLGIFTVLEYYKNFNISDRQRKIWINKLSKADYLYPLETLYNNADIFNLTYKEKDSLLAKSIALKLSV